MNINRKVFFDKVRVSLFNGKLAQSQVEGMNKIISYWEEKHTADYSIPQFAYLLATIKWETGHAMVPIREGGTEAYLRSKRYYPWVGEGLVQVTWERNARLFGATKPGDCMSWPVALRAAFEGSMKGLFTGKKISDYVNDRRCDYDGCRRVINGTDRAAIIAGYARKFRVALEAAASAPVEHHDEMVVAHVPEKGIFDTIADAIDWTRHPETAGAAPNAAPAAPTLRGQSGYILAAIIAAVAALNNIDSAEWARTVQDPSGHLPMILTAIGIAIGNAVLPVWARWLLPKSPRF